MLCIYVSIEMALKSVRFGSSERVRKKIINDHSKQTRKMSHCQQIVCNKSFIWQNYFHHLLEKCKNKSVNWLDSSDIRYFFLLKWLIRHDFNKQKERH